ncbi:SURF1 family protein [Salinactinospora qingdaonensis]|uniref:SURF1-like protein n=2 Tax=Salinactinospora qingdaonensis TaxID=702744 RepID=A0ABP7F9E3_9ACTN
MLAFHALVLAIIPSFIALGFWQYSRWEDKAAQAATQEANLSAEAVPLTDITDIGGEVAPQQRWRTVSATGRYDAEHELLVRNRDGAAGVGLYVVTPLVTDNGAAVLVNRGWVDQPPAATRQPDVPPPPEGTVTVTGRIQYSETPENTGIRPREGLPEGQIMIIETDALAERLPYRLYGGFVELTEQQPAAEPAPEPVAPPEVNTGMHLSYAVQWWVFTAVAIVGWGVLVRREIHDSRQGSPTGDASGDPDATVADGSAASASAAAANGAAVSHGNRHRPGA